MSSNVKQANFRLPLAYMDMIDEFSNREGITKAAVITRALDCLKASYEPGGVTASDGGEDVKRELQDAQAKLAQAEAKAADAIQAKDRAEAQLSTAERARDLAESRASDAIAARDSAEARVRNLSDDLAAERARADSAAASAASGAAAEAESELSRLRGVISKQKKQIEEAEATRGVEVAERDAKIASLSEQLGAANARIELAKKNINVEAVTIGEAEDIAGDDPVRALAMLNMIGGVMNAFQQQVDDARMVGEQEGRKAVQKEFQDMVQKARNDGYRDAMGYLDDRVSTARDSGAREERARIANMSFFERRRYLRMHIA